MTLTELKLLRGAHFEDGSLSFENGVFTDSYTGQSKSCGGLYAVPGYIDVHTHGCIGYTFETASVKHMIEMLRAYAAHGTLALTPTIGTLPYSEMIGAAMRIAEAAKLAENDNTCARVLGVHYEGRFLNPQKAGAHPPELLVKPSPAEAREMAAAVRCFDKSLSVRFTIAPELDGASEFIRTALLDNAYVSLGHTDADFADAQAALGSGAVSFTHVYNAMRPMNHRTSSVLFSALTSGAYAEIISDGLHVIPEALKLFANSVPRERAIVITDSVAAFAEGKTFDFMGRSVHFENGLAVNSDGTIAGGTLGILEAVRRYSEYAEVPYAAAAMAASANPARMLGLRAGSFDEGAHADFILLDADFRPVHIYRGGEPIQPIQI